MGRTTRFRVDSISGFEESTDRSQCVLLEAVYFIKFLWLDSHVPSPPLPHPPWQRRILFEVYFRCLRLPIFLPRSFLSLARASSYREERRREPSFHRKPLHILAGPPTHCPPEARSKLHGCKRPLYRDILPPLPHVRRPSLRSSGNFTLVPESLPPLLCVCVCAPPLSPPPPFRRRRDDGDYGKSIPFPTVNYLFAFALPTRHRRRCRPLRVPLLPAPVGNCSAQI